MGRMVHAMECLSFRTKLGFDIGDLYGGCVSIVVCALVLLEIIKRSADQSAGYQTMADVLGLIFALPYIAVFHASHKREGIQNSGPQPFSRKVFLELFRIRSFRGFLLSQISAYLAMDILLLKMICPPRSLFSASPYPSPAWAWSLHSDGPLSTVDITSFPAHYKRADVLCS